MFLVDIYIMKVWLKFLVLIELLVKNKYKWKLEDCMMKKNILYVEEV